MWLVIAVSRTLFDGYYCSTRSFPHKQYTTRPLDRAHHGINDTMYRTIVVHSPIDSSSFERERRQDIRSRITTAWSSSTIDSRHPRWISTFWHFPAINSENRSELPPLLFMSRCYAQCVHVLTTTSSASPPTTTARPEECPAIKRFAKKKGVEFTMMDKVDVNGVEAHPVYHYLKKVAGPVSIDKISPRSLVNNAVNFVFLIASRLDQ